MLVPLNLQPETGNPLVAMTSVLMSVLAMLGGTVPSRAALHLGILALRRQLQVLNDADCDGYVLGKPTGGSGSGCRMPGAAGERRVGGRRRWIPARLRCAASAIGRCADAP